MMPDEDEEFLLQVATGVADGTILLTTPPRSPSTPREPIVASPIQLVQGGAVEESPAGAEILRQDPVSSAPLDTRGGQRSTEVLHSKRDKKRKRVEQGGKEKALGKHKSKSNSQRSGSSSRYRSFALDEDFSKKSFEEYVSDPVGAAVHTILHLRDIVREEKERSDLQVKEAQLAREAEKNAKESALAELDRAKNHLRMVTLTLATVKESLRVADQLRENLTKERDSALKDLAGSNKRVAELEGKERSLVLEVQRLTNKVSELEQSARVDRGSDRFDRVADLEQKLKASEEKARKTASLALKMREKYFNLAIDQVMVVNPSMSSLKPVFNPTHGVEGGKIVSVDPSSKQKVVVYQPPAQS